MSNDINLLPYTIVCKPNLICLRQKIHVYVYVCFRFPILPRFSFRSKKMYCKHGDTRKACFWKMSQGEQYNDGCAAKDIDSIKHHTADKRFKSEYIAVFRTCSFIHSLKFEAKNWWFLFQLRIKPFKKHITLA